MNGEFIFETMTAYQRAEALKAAIELDLFTAVADGSHIISTLAQKCNASERGMRILCDYLVVHGLLTKDQDEYGLTPESNLFLNRHSSVYFGGATEFWLSPVWKQAFENLATAVRNGGTMLGGKGSLESDHPMWVDYARSMMPMMVFPSEAIAKLLDADSGKKWNVLDVAAGHGLFGIALAKHNPNAEVVAVDWPSVLQIALGNAHRAGVLSRYRAIFGNAFEIDFGNGYDVVLLTNFLHHFDVSTCTEFLRKVYASLNPGGRAVVLDFISNEDRVSPRAAASSGLMMLATTPAGDAYTFTEYESMLRNAGFISNTLHTIPPAVQQVIVSLKAGS